MTAPTTRETADHAELARLAEAATHKSWAAFTDDSGGRPHTNLVSFDPTTDCALSISGAHKNDPNVAFIAAANPATVLSLLSEIAALRGERDRLRNAVSKSNDEICQSLGKALGHPWFKDDQANFPGSTETDGVCVGDHVAESIADEASRRLTQAERQRDELRKALETIGEMAPSTCETSLAHDMAQFASQTIDNQGADQ